MSDDWRRARFEPRVTVNLVDPKIRPDEAPLKERVNREKTLAFRKEVSDKLGRAPSAVESLHANMSAGGQILQPTQELVDRVIARHAQLERATCGTCAHFNRAMLAQFLDRGGYQQLVARLGPEAIGFLGNFTEYAMCEEAEAVVKFTTDGYRCPRYVDRQRKGAFGRMVGGVWRRIQEL